ncbi:MAG: LysR family transcriptional regulator [Pseudomonadota bacterium]
MRLETREMQLMMAVAENRGFKRAAEQLEISQSAISQSISGLERKLEQRLFDRSPFSLTEAGRRLLVYAQSQSREEAAALRDLEDIRRGGQAKLSLAVNGTINRYHAPALLLAYCQSNPFASLQVDELPSRQVLQAVVNGQVELGMGPFQSHMPALESISLYQERRTLVVSRDHGMINELRESPEQALANIPLAASFLDDPEERPGTTRIRDYFSRVWQVRSISMRLRLLAEGQAVGYVTDQVLDRETLCQNLEEVKNLEFSNFVRSVGLVYRKNTTLSPGARQFVRLCRERWSA